MSTDFFIFAAEPSADHHGAKLIEALLSLHPSLKITAVAGPQMRKLPIKTIMDMEAFQVMGFQDVILSLPKLIRQFYQIKRYILKEKPKASVLIDYAEFNQRMATSLRSAHFHGKLIHYICPSIWAWRPGRKQKLEKDLDLLLLIFPFEADLFRQGPLPTQYVGNPSYTQRLIEKEHRADPSRDPDLLGIFPGSRQSEIINNLPFQLKLASLLSLPFKISAASPQLEALIEKILYEHEPSLKADKCIVPSEKSIDLMLSCHSALACSGTVTLELALRELPTLVSYQLSFLNYFLIHHIFRVRRKHYCLANIVAEQSIFPEFYGKNLCPHKAVESLKELQKGGKREEVISLCQELCKVFSKKNASMEAAKSCLQEIFYSSDF